MPTIEKRVPPSVDAPAIVRRELERLVGRRANPDALARVRLLASELVTAALDEGGPEPLRVEAAVTDELVRVEVDRVPPAMQQADDTDVGLILVHALADGWGVEERPREGRCAWFEVALRAAPSRVKRFRRRGARARR